jgi:hypothetical protein
MTRSSRPIAALLTDALLAGGALAGRLFLATVIVEGAGRTPPH